MLLQDKPVSLISLTFSIAELSTDALLGGLCECVRVCVCAHMHVCVRTCEYGGIRRIQQINGLHV